jgi:hypothetical protein
MRVTAAVMAIALAAASSSAALAADDGQQALFGAAFSDPLGLHHEFSGPSFASRLAPVGADAARYVPGEGLVRWTESEVASFGREGAAHFDTVRLSTSALVARPGAVLLGPEVDAQTVRPMAYGVTYVRRWPSMVSVSSGRLSLDITPHAGFGVSSGGARSAEAGALMRMMRVIGMDGPQAPRWFFYAGYNTRAVGLNLVRSDEAMRREKLDGGVVREVQAGLGARKGAINALVGFTREQVTIRSLGERVRDDNRVGLTLSIR